MGPLQVLVVDVGHMGLHIMRAVSGRRSKIKLAWAPGPQNAGTVGFLLRRLV